MGDLPICDHDLRLEYFALALGSWLSLTAWGQWVAPARVWLPLTGRLPWALIEFLDDAQRRGACASPVRSTNSVMLDSNTTLADASQMS
ncbi:hypothetical protein SO3561_09174 [Streptomyces olivochromogenes]|uniref:Uncharacterized protein n=1 Tax=Streptomyces olivochromogenes TaxID=1963 RepID=A0A250VU15_STROL|nr:hypothetical protein SO3561_09174 [Streptomyces olivochromogenes]